MFLAHDDLDALEPKFAITKMLVKPANFEIPISIAITNKRLGYPSDDATAVRLKSHIEAAVEGVQMCLISDIKEIRALALEKQGEPDPRYTSHYGSQKINGNELNVPDILGDGWMDPKAPGFGDIKNGYRYEPFSFKFDFYGPETIILPNGGKIEMQPPLSDRPGVVDYRPNNS